jgi:hypothetical protein
MKRFSIGVLAILMAFGFAAFTVPHSTSSSKLDNHKYRYQPNLDGDYDDPDNYVYTEDLTGCGEDVTTICIIDAPGGTGVGVHPDFPDHTDPEDNSLNVTVYSWKPE